MLRECSLLTAINSEFIVSVEDVYDFNGQIFAILELMEGGDLSKIVPSYREYSENFCRYTLWCVAKGLQAMHEMGIIHRDIKSENILCREDGAIKIADLGVSVFLNREQSYRKTTRVGTPAWLSPEIANGTIYSKEVDIWAFGCFAQELATGEPPFLQI